MAGRLRRVWPRRLRQTSDKRKTFTVIPALVGVGLALLLLWRLDAALRPTLAALASAQAEQAVRGAAEEALGRLLAENPELCGGLYTVHTGPDGAVATLEADSAKLSALRSELLAQITSEVKSLDSDELAVPLGSLTGWSLFSNRGPAVGVEVLAVNTPSAEFRSSFQAAGVNQTLHRVTLEVTVEVTLLLPGGATVERVDISLPVSEIVVVGETPQTYLNLTP